MSKSIPKKSILDEPDSVIEGLLKGDDLVVLTKSEACRYLKCGMSTLPKLDLPVIRVGRSVKYLKKDLQEFLLNNRKGGSNE